MSVSVKEVTTFLLLGQAGLGKSATGNSILNRKQFKSLDSPSVVTRDVDYAFSKFDIHILKVVDSPPVEDEHPTDIEATERAVRNMHIALSKCYGGVDAFLFVVKFGSQLTEDDRYSLNIYKQIFGDSFTKHLIVVVTGGDLFEKEDNKIWFEEWCKQLELGKLYKDCKGRFVLFNNRETDEEKKKGQIQILIQKAANLQVRKYTNENFEQARAGREKMILEMRAPFLREEIQAKMSLLTADIEKFVETGLSSDRIMIRRKLKAVEKEIEDEDKGFGVLDDLRVMVKRVRKDFDVAVWKVLKLGKGRTYAVVLAPIVMAVLISLSFVLGVAVISGILAAAYFGVTKFAFTENKVEHRKKINWLLIGKLGGGRSAAGNSILGHKAFKALPMSERKEVKAGYTDYEGYRLKVVDGQCLEDTDVDKVRDTEAAAENLGKAMMMCSEGVDAFLYVMSFGSKFTAEEMSSLESLKHIFGEKYFNHVIVIVTKGDLFHKSMEEKERNISFEEWCMEQDGEFRELYKKCSGRFVLFNNWEEHEDKKKAQVQKLIKVFETLQGRYKYVSFEKAKDEREKLILEMKAPELTEEIQEKIGLLRAEIYKWAVLKPPRSTKTRVQQRIEQLKDEVKEKNKVYGVLDNFLKNVEKLKDIRNDYGKLVKAANKTDENTGVLLWNVIKAGTANFSRLLYRSNYSPEHGHVI